MPDKPIRGVVPILVTPFDDAGAIDEASLARLIEFNISAGVHGLGVAIGSEIFKLSEAERDRVIVCVVKSVAGRVPVIINTGAAGTDLAIFYSRRAEELGADAVMVIPPNFLPAGPEEIADYYRQIGRAVRIPIVLQDVVQAPISPALALRIAEESPKARYIKVETPPVVPRVAEMAARAGGALTVLGGAGGGYFIEEMRRGAQGTMPFCSQPEAFVTVWDLFQRGDEAGARRVFETTLLPVIRLGQQGGDVFYHVHKQLLVRLGVIRKAHVRSPTTPIDGTTQSEIDALLQRLVPGPIAFEG